MDTWAVMVEDDTLRQNSKKTYNVEFNFDKCWDGYSKTVIFEAGPASVIVALTEDHCTIPAECLKHGSVKLQIGIYGVNGDERKGTIWCLASMIIPDATMNMGSSSPSPDDIYSEIMAAIGDLAEPVLRVRHWLRFSKKSKTVPARLQLTKKSAPC